jgi:LacI family transcriptional regulator
MGVTIRDVAERAKVSISTVSRVLNDTCNVREDKRIRVLEAAALLGYTPNPAAQSLHSMKTGAIGILLPYVSGEFFAELLNGIDAAAQEGGRLLLISTSHNSEDELEAALRGMYRRVDGIPLITFDNYSGMRAMTEHLIGRGHQRIGFITGPAEAHDAQERFRGFREALFHAGLPLNEDLVVDGQYTQQAGYDGTKYLIGLDRPPTAIMTSNDDAALGAMSALREAHLRIPEDMALCGFDDIPSAAFTVPPLTTVHIPVRELGKQSVELLEAAIDRGLTPGEVSIKLPLDLRLRGST